MSTLTRPQTAALVGIAALGVLWLVTGSFVMALVVLVFVGGVAGLGWVLVSGRVGSPRPRSRTPRPRTSRSGGPATVVTTDLSSVPGPGAGIRRVLRLALARPWVRGEGLVRASTARVTSDDALVWMPRGERAGAPHLWVEWNAVDAAEIADRWPLELLARELLDAHVGRVRADGTRCLQDRTWLHVLGRDDVPVGRVVVTAAFSGPQETVLVAVSAPSGRAPEQPSPKRPGPRQPGPKQPGPKQLMESGGRRPAPRAPHPAVGRTVMMGRGRR